MKVNVRLRLYGAEMIKHKEICMKLVKQHFTAVAVLFLFVCAAGFSSAADAAKAMEKKEMKKILVVYYSRTGNTEKVAKDIAKVLNADVEKLIDKKDRSGVTGYLGGGKDAAAGNLAEIEPLKKDPSKYDLVIIGTPVWAWTMSPAVRTYITRNKDNLKQIALFTTAGGTGPDKIIKKMEELAGKKAVTSAGFVEDDLEDESKTSYSAKVKTFTDKCN